MALEVMPLFLRRNSYPHGKPVLGPVPRWVVTDSKAVLHDSIAKYLQSEGSFCHFS